MELGCTGLIQVMCILENGVMGSAMDMDSILVRMEAVTLENLNGVLNMGLAVTISGIFCTLIVKSLL